QPTALVHEAYLRLVGGNIQGVWEGRDHFYAACAEAMRHILVDNARRKQTVKHGGGGRRVPLEEVHRVARAPPGLLDLAAPALPPRPPAPAGRPGSQHGPACFGSASPPGCPPPRRPPRWASRSPPPSAGGPSPAPGCTANCKAAARRRNNSAGP